MGALFSSFGIDWRLLIINCINFGLLLWILSYFLYAPIMRVLEERRQKVLKGMEDAEAAAEKLSKIEAQRAEKLAQAGHEADEVLARARAAGLKREKEAAAEAEAAASRVAVQAAAEAREIRERAIAESKQEIAKLVVLGTEKLLREKVSA